MADIRDWGAFVRGRWDWTKHGYEKGFPRGCQFTDIDATVEFDGRRLVIEPKHYDGIGPLPGRPATGQLLFLKDEVSLGKAVLVLYGCGACNDPYAIYDIGRDEWFRWQDDGGVWLPKAERRKRLKNHIDRAMGLFSGSDPSTTPTAVDPRQAELHAADPPKRAGGEWPDAVTARPPDYKAPPGAA